MDARDKLVIEHYLFMLGKCDGVLFVYHHIKKRLHNLVIITITFALFQWFQRSYIR